MKFSKLSIIKNISIIKTIRFNCVYFGVKGISYPYFLIGKNVILRNVKGRISVNNGKRFAFRIGVYENELLSAKKEYSIFDNIGEIQISNSCNLVCGAKVINRGLLILGDDLSVNGNTSLICHKKIKIGNSCNFSWGSLIMDTDFHKIFDNENCVINDNKEVSIGNNVWIGANCILLKGSKIPDGSILAAGSRFSKTNCIVDKNSILSSNYHVIKADVSWSIDEPN